MTLTEIGKRAKIAAAHIAALSTRDKNTALVAIADALLDAMPEILAVNAEDLIEAKANNLPAPMVKRLALSQEKIVAMADMVREVAASPDPIGQGVSATRRPNGLRIERVRVPLGVVAIIYEARPNVTTDCVALCLKSGNACILRGGKEALRSNIAIMRAVNRAIADCNLPEGCAQLIEDTSRETATDLMRLNEYVDVLIPRGGASLIRSVVENATIPTIETGTGNCHIYVEASAPQDVSLRIIHNAKTTAPAVCNSVEKVLVDAQIAQAFLPKLRDALPGVELRGCARAGALLSGLPVVPDDAAEWNEEYLDLVLGVRVVDGLEDAIAWINQHGTKHSEAILTNRYDYAQRFLSAVDAAAVYVNASTRFTDGNEFGYGAEIGISTQKLHVRGPMGLEALTSTKFMIYGEGQIR